MPDDRPFSRVVCGIDGSDEAIEAARAAGRLAPDGAHVHLVSVLARDAPTALDEPAAEGLAGRLAAARAAVREAVVVAAGTAGGRPAQVLEERVASAGADVVAVGSHGYGRSVGIVLGSVATRLIHAAPCSVLIARAVTTAFPRAIAVGIDGSQPSLRALATARELALRTGAPLRVLHVLDGARPRGALQAGLEERVEEITAAWSTAEALCGEVTAADLLVVGSRGLRGLRALGSTSEAVAHRSPSSVLVVKGGGPGPHPSQPASEPVSARP